MLDRGIGREILVVAHDKKLLSINFLGKKSTKIMIYFLTYGLFYCKFIFFGNHLTK
jgi:hypothetical protein